jgi:hypothetical protein
MGGVDQLVIDDGTHKDEVFETTKHRQSEENDFFAGMTKDFRKSDDWRHPAAVDKDSRVPTEILGIE